MKERLKRWLGLNRPSSYIRKYFDDANIYSSIYMSFIVIILETWMIFSVIGYAKESNKLSDLPWMLSHFGWYVTLLLSGISIFIYSVLSHFFHRKLSYRVWYVLLALFVIIGLAFGIHFGINSYAKGDQILSFMTMSIFIFCLMVWRPVTGGVLSIITFSYFYYRMAKAGTVTYGDQVNLFTTWVTILMVVVGAYHQRMTAATKDEKLENINAHLRKLAHTDELTGLPNMRAFRESCADRLKATDLDQTQTEIIYINIEHFHTYNESYGYAAGDLLLQGFADSMQKHFEGDPIARVSDDHFAALLVKSTGEAKVRAVEAYLHEQQREINLEIKVGSFIITDPDCNIDSCLENARSAANTLKKRYDDNYRVYDEHLRDELSQKQYVINHIDTAIRSGYIEAFYQPLINSQDGTLCGLEALARWRDPKLGLLPPFCFIPVLEEHRQINKLDREIIRIVCRDIASRKDTPLQNIPVSINFSRLDFELYDVPDAIRQAAESYGIPCSSIDVEITESALNGNTESLMNTMEVIRKQGCSQWLDDFGSGYSSLNVLKDFHFDVLKIDMIFLRSFETNPNSRIILKSVIDMAKNLGMKTIAEGVETRDQYEYLQEIGCDMIQGYYFGKPMAQKELMNKIESGILKVPHM